jgi:hypothetical protein
MLKNMLKLGAVLIAAILVTGAVAAQNAVYTFTTIDVPGSTNTEAIGINKQGAIVGKYVDVRNAEHGFLAKPTGQ